MMILVEDCHLGSSGFDVCTLGCEKFQGRNGYVIPYQLNLDQTPTMPDLSYLFIFILFGIFQKRLPKAKKIEVGYCFLYEFFKIWCFC
jgi:hypothetical protein